MFEEHAGEWNAAFTRPFQEAESRLLTLRQARVSDPDSTRDAIASLQAIEEFLWRLAHESKMSTWSGFTDAEFASLMDLYRRQVKVLRASDGMDLSAARRALRNAVRLAVFLFLMAADHYEALAGIAVTPGVLDLFRCCGSPLADHARS